MWLFKPPYPRGEKERALQSIRLCAVPVRCVEGASTIWRYFTFTFCPLSKRLTGAEVGPFSWSPIGGSVHPDRSERGVESRKVVLVHTDHNAPDIDP